MNASIDFDLLIVLTPLRRCREKCFLFEFFETHLFSKPFFKYSTDRIDIYDARDAIEACSGLWGEEKETCYAIFGVAPEADEWYDVVFKLETALDMDTCTLQLINDKSKFQNLTTSCFFIFCSSRGRRLPPRNRTLLEESAVRLLHVLLMKC